MRVKLRVIRGSTVGRLVSVPGEKFVIGRAEECNLRPRTDLISRRHCALIITQSQVSLEDYGSSNGTYLNGDRIEGSCGLKSGDIISVGPLEFEVLMDHKLSGDNRPKVKDIQDVASRTADGSVDDMDVSKWLEEADEEDRQQRIVDPETRQYKLDETDEGALNGDADPTADTVLEESADDTEKSEKKKFKAQFKQPGKLEPIPEKSADSSKDAAHEMLKKFFKK